MTVTPLDYKKSSELMKILIRVEGDRLERLQIYYMLGYNREDIHWFETSNLQPCYMEYSGFYSTFSQERGVVAVCTLSLNKCNNLGRM